MLGLMQDAPLTIDSILKRGEQYFPQSRVVTRTVNGKERTTFTELAVNARRIGSALDRLGLSADARVGTFSWNTARHLELYFAVPSTGRVLHTINLRYFPEHVVYTVGHAEDEAVFVDRSLVPLFARYLPQLETVKHVIVTDDGAPGELPDDSRVITFEDFIAGADEADFEGRVTEENTAAALCYTTGTTGDPKGVLYSHRSIWLHGNAGTAATGTAVTERDNILPVVRCSTRWPGAFRTRPCSPGPASRCPARTSPRPAWST
jgi:fatty-acyl-CoA synthase